MPRLPAMFAKRTRKGIPARGFPALGRRLHPHRDRPERLVLLPGRLAALVELEQREERHRHGHAIGAFHRLVEREAAAAAGQQVAQERHAVGQRDARDRHVAQVERRRRAQQRADRLAEHLRVVGALGRLDRHASQVRRQRRHAVQERLAGGVRGGGPAAGAAEARVLEHPLEQLLRRLGGRQPVELVEHLLAGQHQPRLELQQRRDQDQELGGGLEVELALGLQVVDVGDHDLGQLDLQQVQLVAQDERQQQVERPGEDVQVELEALHDRGHGSRQARRPGGRGRRPSPRGRRRASRWRSRAPSRRPSRGSRSSSASSPRSSW